MLYLNKYKLTNTLSRMNRSPIVTRSVSMRNQTIQTKKEEMDAMLSSIGAVFSGYGQGYLMIRFKYQRNPLDSPQDEYITFKLIDNKFRVQYCDFFPYGYPTNFKRIHNNNTRLMNSIEEYLRAKGENFKSYSLDEYFNRR